MTSELLSLIKGWRERHPEAWPEEVRISTDGRWLVLVCPTVEHHDMERADLAMIEVAVLDTLPEQHELSICLDDKRWWVQIGAPIFSQRQTTRRRNNIDRLHALLAAVAEMESQ